MQNPMSAPGTRIAVERIPDAPDALDALADIQRTLASCTAQMSVIANSSLGVKRGQIHLVQELQLAKLQMAKAGDVLGGLVGLIDITRRIEQMHAAVLMPYSSGAGDWMLDDVAPAADTQALAVVPS